MNEIQYNQATSEERRKWHNKVGATYNRELKNLQKTTTVVNEDSPKYKEMVELQELFRFHTRQGTRIKKYNHIQDFYSLELETNRRKRKGLLTPQGNLMPYVELSQEVYDTLSIDNQIKYHSGMRDVGRITGEERLFHTRMGKRLHNSTNYPTFAASKYGGEQGKRMCASLNFNQTEE